MPNKREGVVYIFYSSSPFISIPINNYIYNIGGVFFSYFLFGALAQREFKAFGVSGMLFEA